MFTSTELLCFILAPSVNMIKVIRTVCGNVYMLFMLLVFHSKYSPKNKIVNINIIQLKTLIIIK